MTAINLTQLANINFSPTYAKELLIPFLIYLIGIVIYSMFVFHFYRYLASKDIFKIDLNKYDNAKFPFIAKLTSFYTYILKYFILFPVFASFWSLFLAVLIIFLTDSQTVQTTLLISVALVSAIRVTAYYNEDLSRDLAKMLPFALLGVFIIDINFFSLQTAIANVKSIPSYYITLVYYFAFIVGLELVLRPMSWFFSLFKKDKG